MHLLIAIYYFFYLDPADRRQTLISSVVHVSAFHPYMTTVWIDRSLGHDTEFTFQYDTNVPEVSMKSPNGSVYQSGNSSYFEHDSSLKILSFTPTSMSQVRPYGVPYTEVKNLPNSKLRVKKFTILIKKVSLNWMHLFIS